MKKLFVLLLLTASCATNTEKSSSVDRFKATAQKLVSGQSVPLGEYLDFQAVCSASEINGPYGGPQLLCNAANFQVTMVRK